MSVISFAVIGKNRQPIYINEFSTSTGTTISSDDDLQLFGISTPTSSSSSSPTNVLDDKTSIDSHDRCDCSIRQQFIIHDALDYMEQWIESNSTKNHPSTNNPLQPQNAHDAMFAGLLCPVEDMRVYGYMTTTQIIFLIVTQDNGTAMDETIKKLCITLHRYYVEYILNPFTPITTSTKAIESKQFHSKVQEYIKSFNNNHAFVR